MTEIYHGVILGGNKGLVGGRNIAGFRLRTEARKYGYNILVLDSSVSMSEEELEALLEVVITSETLILGISTVWLNGYDSLNPIPWINESFFMRIKNKFKNIRLIAGGPDGNWVLGSFSLRYHADWVLNGFSDVSFVRLLDYISGKSNTKMKYTLGNHNKKIINSNTMYQIEKPNDIETVFEKDDDFEPYQPIPLEVSRGCIFRCSFCNHPFQGAKDYDSYIRTPDNIANELRRNYELFGTTRYSIMDDTFNDSVEKLDRLKRAIEIAKLPDFKFQAYIKPELLVTKPEMIPMLADLGLASGFVGIESLQDEARRAIRKGMGIDRVLDAIVKLNSSAKTKMSAGFIIGLTGDSLDDNQRTYEYLVKHRHTLFRSWIFHHLTLFYDGQLNGFSEIDKYPEKFGYTITKKVPSGFAAWENKHMTSVQASDLAKELNAKSENVMLTAGWQVPLAWHLNIDEMDVELKPIKELRLVHHGRISNREHAIKTLKKFGIIAKGPA